MQAVSVTKATKTFFVMCNECFWCASLLGARPIDECPSCSKAPIEVMPLAANERYAFDCNAVTGVTLSFHQRRAAPVRHDGL